MEPGARVFDMVPPSGTGFNITLAVIVVLLAGVAALVLWMGLSSRNVTFEISPGGLRIRSTFYGRNVPLEDLELERAAVLDLRSDCPHRLSWKTNGIGMPGLSVGWFKAVDGEKMLAFVSERGQVVYVPTRNNFALLLSPAQPYDMLAAIRTAAVPRR